MTGCGTSRRRSYIALPLQVRGQREQGGGEGPLPFGATQWDKTEHEKQGLPLALPLCHFFCPLAPAVRLLSAFFFPFHPLPPSEK